MARQQIPTNNVLESVSGKVVRPTLATTALSPSAGSMLVSPPKVTQLIGVDYQLTTSTQTNYSAGSYYNVVWPAVGFVGLLSSAQKVLSSYNMTNSFFRSLQNTSIVNNLANNINPLVVGNTTQLLLVCSMQTINPNVSTVTMYPVNLLTQAIETQMSVALVGPWFPSGTSYLGFSCLPSTTVFCSASESNFAFTIGISAQLYAVFNQ